MKSKSVINNYKRVIIVSCALALSTGCKKTNYLDVEASNRLPLAAKISFVNARPGNQGINFYTYTTQVTSTPVLMNKATSYIDAQFGLVQINYAVAGSTSYLSSRVFGGSAEFNSGGGPNGPIAGYFHTVFALKATASNFAADSVMLLYDDLSAPAAGNSKVRFINLSPRSEPVDVSFSSNTLFTNVRYGAVGGSVLSGAGLNAFSIGPFKNVPAGTGSFIIKTSGSGVPIKLNSTEIDNLNLKAGNIYTIFISGDANEVLNATILQHN